MESLSQSGKLSYIESAWLVLKHFGAWLRREFRAARPVFWFFLIGFLLMLTIVKLALAQYSIEVSTISRAVIGALVAAKIVLLLDETPVATMLAGYPRVFSVAGRTVVYATGVILLGFLERIFEAHRQLGGLALALRTVEGKTNMNQLLAIAIGTSLVFAAYFAVAEIDKAMGEGALWALFFKTSGYDRKLKEQQPTAPVHDRIRRMFR